MPPCTHPAWLGCGDVAGSLVKQRPACCALLHNTRGCQDAYLGATTSASFPGQAAAYCAPPCLWGLSRAVGWAGG